MKRSVLLSILIISLIFIPLIIADEVDDKINVAYTCLENKVVGNCNSLSSEEKIFSLLAIEECKDEVISNSANNECWPSSSCNLKTTSQAVLALDNMNVNVSNATRWLLSQNTIPLGIEWYLEIENTQTISEPYSCTITSISSSNSITIGLDKKISSISGSTCLSLSETPYEDYFLEVNPSCYNKEFSISCDQSFLTTLLYKKSDSPILYVSDKTSSASADGITTEKVDFSCFKQGNTCDYEGSLWAAFVLNYLDEDISFYKPYLVTMAEDNPQYIPEAFLYLIEPSDTNFRTILLSKQQGSMWWSASGDKYYDTALALLPFQDENPIEKTNSKNWLLDVQDAEGCWQGNIGNTAFILYSIWPKDLGGGNGGGGGTDSLNCEDVDGYCIFETSCSDIGGSELSAYEFSCSGSKICCDTSPTSQTCEEIGGEICDSDEICSISNIETFDTYDCCIGDCESTEVPQSECEEDGGTCRDSCLSSEEKNSDECDYPGEVCCEDDTSGSGGGTTEEPKSYWWIWVLLILIVLVVMGIIFRDKLRPFWLRIKSKFKRKPKTPSGHPLTRPSLRRPIHRMISPSRRRPLQSRPTHITRPTPTKRPKSELDDVLKKLKDIGK